jgi:hypothetical protein
MEIMDETKLLEYSNQALAERNRVHQEILPLGHYEMVTTLLDNYYDVVRGRLIDAENFKDQNEFLKHQLIRTIDRNLAAQNDTVQGYEDRIKELKNQIEQLKKQIK